MEKSYDVWTSQQDTASRNLVEECICYPPNKKLSSRLRRELERMQPEERSKVVARMHDGCSPLFLACRNGNVKIVKYLVNTCGADVNQNGEYHGSNYINEYGVTPLWLAADTANLSMVRVLADAGADLNAVSYRGSTPLIAACESFSDDVVKFLIDRGADIKRTNYEGETCLMKLLHCVALCEIVVKEGINVNACSTYGETALHLSVKKNNVTTTDLLLRHGADPYVPLPEGGDVLQLACLFGNTSMVNLLIQGVRYPHERLANMYDLLAATLFLKHGKVEEALSQWRHSLVLRAQHHLPKRSEIAPHVALQFAREFCNEDELLAAATDRDALQTQALLVYERLLGSGVHRAFCDLVMACGLRYAKTIQHQRCVDLLLWVLEVCLRNSVLGSEMCNTARELTRLFQDAHAGRIRNLNNCIPRIQDVLQAFSLLVDSVPDWSRALGLQGSRNNKWEFNGILMYITHLLHLLLSVLEQEGNKEERQRWEQLLHEKLCWLVTQDVRHIITGDTLLHLCVSLEHTPGFSLYNVVQSLRCVRVLLAAGAEVNSRNLAGRSPLHLVAYNIGKSKINSKIVLELLEAGAHIDQPDSYGRTPAALLAANPSSRIPLQRYQTLQCLAANVLVRRGVKLDPSVLPKKIIQFLQLHMRD